jgi:hypothetical protein
LRRQGRVAGIEILGHREVLHPPGAAGSPTGPRCMAWILIHPGAGRY